jgi:hypothetical protein
MAMYRALKAALDHVPANTSIYTKDALRLITYAAYPTAHAFLAAFDAKKRELEAVLKTPFTDEEVSGYLYRALPTTPSWRNTTKIWIGDRQYIPSEELKAKIRTEHDELLHFAQQNQSHGSAEALPAGQAHAATTPFNPAINQQANTPANPFKSRFSPPPGYVDCSYCHYTNHIVQKCGKLGRDLASGQATQGFCVPTDFEFSNTN